MSITVPLPADEVTASSRAGGHRVAILYALTIFLSAFLLFQVQPIVARSILPWFGGTAAVWSACLAFFQLGLLAGYAYAAVAARYFDPRSQGITHLALLAISVVALPIVPDPAWKNASAGDPASRIVALLTMTIGLPYFLLSATSPLLQMWYARARERGSPYRLFALSNAGSMLALLTYPIVVEPVLGTHAQAVVWSCAYGAFVLLCGSCAIRQWKSRRLDTASPSVALDSIDTTIPSPSTESRTLWKTRSRPEFSTGSRTPNPESREITWTTPTLWLALPACASILLLAVTSHLTQDIAPVPFLWVLPLALYLLSFVLCFDRDWWYRRAVWMPLLAVALGGLAYSLFGDYEEPDIRLMILLTAAGLFICCMFCHGELARLRPDPRDLTAFYVMCAAGGALGGIFVGLIAPHVFRTHLELPVGLVMCALLAVIVVRVDPRSRLYRAIWHPLWLAMGALTIALAAYLTRSVRDDVDDVRVMARNFYGVVHTYDTTAGNGEPIRKLRHGAITHGLQILEEARRREPGSYYGAESAISLVMRDPLRPAPRHVGVVGLGAGTLAAFGQPGDRFRFYEINPVIPGIARREFTFLADSPAAVEIVPGDARVSLEREPRQQFDVLVVDAFSGDSIPAHLLTREAFEAYFRHLAPDGALAVHISNRYLDLRPVVSKAAEVLGKATLVVDTDDPNDGVIYGTTWVLVANRRDVLDRSPLREAGTPLDAASPRFRLWTDDYSNLFQVIE